ncbi:L,D-transpeptidase [Priestia megaterium]|uniref:L,D-transpeptidase n=1 Tax=Priestia megaterium TaxID=1404 RepID=UPI001F0FB489|nr:L,D-transpeptidase [Priestia megaterium]
MRKEAASKAASQDLIIINKYYNKLAYFHNGYIEIVDSVATGKTSVGFFKVVNKIKNCPYYTGHIYNIRFYVMSPFFHPKYSFYPLFFRHFLYLFFFIM